MKRIGQPGYKTAFYCPLRDVDHGQKSFLHLLHEEELLHVLRHLSARPRSALWQSEVSPVDALSVLRIGGPLSEFARNEFLCVSTRRKTSNSSALHVDDKDCDGRTMFEDLLEELSPTLREIRFLVSAISPNEHLRIAETCVSLESLHVTSIIRYSFRAILEACSGNLRELAIDIGLLDDDSVCAIAEHCGGLKKFDLRCSVVQGKLCEVWRAIGPTLVHMSVDIHVPDYSYTLCDEIVSHCVNVSSFGFGLWSIARSPLLVRFCEGFGSRLKFLTLYEENVLPTRAEINKILDACPDLVVDAFVPERHDVIFAEFRDRLRSVTIDTRLDSYEAGAGEAALSLEELKLKAYDAEESVRFLSRFLSSSKPCLKSLYISGLGLDINGNAFDIVARRLSSIEILSVYTSRMIPGMFRDIAKANKGLKRVHVSSQGLYEAAIISFVQDFSQCPALKELVLENSSLAKKSAKIAEACIAFRGRAVDIFIGRTQYYCSL